MKYRVKAVVSFDGMRAGHEVVVDETPRLMALISRGYLKVLEEVTEDGASQVGPSGPEESGGTIVPNRTPRRRKAGSEPGEDSDAG